MKIAVVGNFKWVHYQQALLDGFRSIAETKEAFPIQLEYYPFWNLWGVLRNSLKLYAKVKICKPDVVFLYRVDHIFPVVFAVIKRRFGPKILIYHNDDPYNKTLHRPQKHYFFLRTLKHSDITYVYRDVNLGEAAAWGAPKVKLMRAYFYSKLDCPPTPQAISMHDKKPCIVFIGHYEEDSRIAYLDALFRANINVHIYGHAVWRKAFDSHQWPISHLHNAVYDQEYRDSLRSAYAALAFFSEKNRDDYTRRCFEIPMAQTLLFAPKTAFMNSTFKNGENAVLFSNVSEMVVSAKKILENPEWTMLITEAGYNHILNGGFSEVDTARKIISDIEEL